MQRLYLFRPNKNIGLALTPDLQAINMVLRNEKALKKEKAVLNND